MTPWLHDSVTVWLDPAFRNFLCNSGRSDCGWIVASINWYCPPCNVCVRENRTDTGTSPARSHPSPYHLLPTERSSCPRHERTESVSWSNKTFSTLWALGQQRILVLLEPEVWRRLQRYSPTTCSSIWSTRGIQGDAGVLGGGRARLWRQHRPCMAQYKKSIKRVSTERGAVGPHEWRAEVDIVWSLGRETYRLPMPIAANTTRTQLLHTFSSPVFHVWFSTHETPTLVFLHYHLFEIA